MSPCRGARYSASPHSLRASSRPPRASYHRAGRARPAAAAPGEHRAMRLDVDQATRARDRRVVGRRVLETHVQEPASSPPAGGTSSGPGHARTAHQRRVESATLALDVLIEAGRVEDRIQSRVERMPRARGSSSDIAIHSGVCSSCRVPIAKCPQSIERDRSCRSLRAAQAAPSPRAAMDEAGPTTVVLLARLGTRVAVLAGAPHHSTCLRPATSR